MPREDRRLSSHGRRAWRFGALSAGFALFPLFVASMLSPSVAGVGVADPGFESGFLPGPYFPPMPMSFGHWESETDSGRLASSPEPVNTGVWSAVVDTMNASIGSIIVQDFDSGTLGYDFEFWVYPDEGVEGVGIVYNWDRGITGARILGTSFSLSPTQTGFAAWDATLTLPPIPFKTWHWVQVHANKCTRTQDLYIDSVFQGSATASASATISSGNATVYFGDGSWVARHGRFYWDDFAFTSWDCAASGPPDYVLSDANPASPLVTGLSRPTPLSVTVTNLGGPAANASELTFANGTTPSNPFAVVSVPPILAGGSAGPFTVNWISPTTPGTYTVTAFADANDAVPESSETNNTHAWTINVVPGPITTLRVGSPNYTASVTYVTSRTQLRFSTLDQGGVGILRTAFRVDGASWTDTNGPFALVTEGTRRLEWYSEDRVGNVEATHSATIVVDDTPPQTALAPDGVALPADASVALSANDGGSGVDRTQFKIDDGPWVTYASELRLPAGGHRIAYRSVDHLGNLEPEQARVLTIAAEMNWKPVVAAIFASVLAGIGAWSSRRTPWTRATGERSVSMAFAITALPFVLGEVTTGVVSYVTGWLSIPPIVGLGTGVDCAILATGVLLAALRSRRHVLSPPA